MADGKQAVERIHRLTGIRLSESQTRGFMKNLGMKLRNTAPVPGKCDHQLQFDFYTRKLLSRLEEARIGERKVLFVDAAHFVLGAFLGLDLVREKCPQMLVSLVMDNARYRHCKAVKAHAAKLDIKLLFLPPSSPNLNLIERVWKLTKKKCLTNKYHKDFAGFRTAIDQCLDGFEDHLKPELKTLMALNFQFFLNQKS